MEPILNLIGIIAGVAVSFTIGYKTGFFNGQRDEYNQMVEEVAKNYSHMQQTKEEEG